MPVVSLVDSKVAAALERAGLAGRGNTIVVGVSGGADSSTLLYSLNRLREACDIELHVAHLNHDFRGAEADEDARFVGALASELGLPFSVEKRDPIAYQRERHISSFEQGAREMRYRFMASVAQRIGAPAVAVGHTSDDQAETVLLHILRGAGLHGLRGMTETAPWPFPPGLESPFIFRPLLEVTKSETVEYCRELQRDYRQDSGNSLFRFTRNRVRQDLLPSLAADYNPRVREALVRLASSASLDLDYLQQELDRAWPELLLSSAASTEPGQPSTTVVLGRRPLSSLHPALVRMALRRAYVAVNGDSRRLRENHLRAMADFIAGNSRTGELALPSGISLHATASEIIFQTGQYPSDCPYPQLAGPWQLSDPDMSIVDGIYYPAEWRVSIENVAIENVPDLRLPDAFTAWFHPASLGTGLLLRNRSAGDRFQPLGMANFKRLHNFLIDEKVPRHWRDRVPLLVSDRGIAWVVGYRIAEWAKVPRDLPPGSPVMRMTFELSEQA
ncbi:MAG: tRNA lysidine(34) synthetase TilS [Chloroflexota bacterium]|nr:tRNA lysidine(34) synthetase TilS [Chloroflexota bacterium]